MLNWMKSEESRQLWWVSLLWFEFHFCIGLNDSDIWLTYLIKVADRVAKEFEISAVYSSDLKRALETAKTIANACGGIQVLACAM